MRRRPRVNQDVLERATFLGCWFKWFFESSNQGSSKLFGVACESCGVVQQAQ